MITCSEYSVRVIVPAPKTIAIVRTPLASSDPDQEQAERRSPASALPIVWARSNGVVLCGATTSSHCQGPPVGVLPNIPPEIALISSGPEVAGGPPPSSSASTTDGREVR